MTISNTFKEKGRVLNICRYEYPSISFLGFCRVQKIHLTASKLSYISPATD